MKTLKRTSATRSAAILTTLVALLVTLALAILGGDPVLYAVVLIVGSFLVVMLCSPDSLIDAYMWITFLVLIYQYATKGEQIFILNSVKDGLLILLWLYVLVRGVIHRGRGIASAWTWGSQNVLSVIFFSYAAFQIARSDSLRVGILGFRKTAQFFTVFWLAQVWFQRASMVRSWAKHLTIIALLTAVLGLVQKGVGLYLDEKIVVIGDVFFRRITSTYGNPNTFAAVLLTGVLLLLNRYLAPVSGRGPVFPLVPLGILMVPFLFAYSVSGLAALAAGVLTLLLLHRSSISRKLTLIFFLGLIGITVIAVTPLYYGRIYRIEQKLSDPISMEREGRYIKWRECLNLWETSPLFGVGYGKFGGILQPASGFIIENIVDNSYLLLLIQYGLVGLGLFGGLLFTIFRQAFRAWQTLGNPELKEQAAGLISILVAYCVIAFPLNLWEMMFPVNFLFWLCSGMLFRLNHLETTGEFQGGSRATR